MSDTSWSSCQFLPPVLLTFPSWQSEVARRLFRCKRKSGLVFPLLSYGPFFKSLFLFRLVIRHRASLIFHSWPRDSRSIVSHLVDGRLGLFPNPVASKEQKRPFYDTMTNFNLQQNSPESRDLTALMMSCPVQMITSAFPASRVTCSAPPPRERDSYWFRHTTGPFAGMVPTRAFA